MQFTLVGDAARHSSAKTLLNPPNVKLLHSPVNDLKSDLSTISGGKTSNNFVVV